MAHLLRLANGRPLAVLPRLTPYYKSSFAALISITCVMVLI